MPRQNDKSSLKILASAGLCFLILGFAFSCGPDGLGFFNESWTDETRNIILFDIRLPRILVSAISGGALAVAGVLSQGLFRNPLAGPSILGTVSGANLLVITLMFLGFAQDHWLIQPVAAFLGAVFCTVLILKLSTIRSLSSPGRLLLMGFALNAMMGAMITFLLSLSLHRFSLSQSMLQWLMGGFNGKGWDHFYMGIPWLAVGFIFAFKASRKLDVLNLGEDIAQTLSVPVSRMRIQLILIMSLLVGASVAVAGGVSFVGLIVPHFTRLYLGATHRNLTLCSLFNGISLVVIADTMARTLWAPQEIQVGAILSLIGAPIFIALLLGVGKKGTSNDML